jgi:hypothetical protein
MAMVAVGGCDGFAALRLFTPVFRKIDQKTCSVQVRRSALIASLNKRLCCTESGCDILQLVHSNERVYFIHQGQVSRNQLGISIL